MRKISVIKNLSVLLSFGVIVKTLGLFHKVILTRTLTLEGLALYTKMGPIAGLFSTVASFSLGSTITQMVAKNVSTVPYSNRKLIIKGFLTATVMASLVSIIHLLSNHLICYYLLRMPELQKPFLFFIPLYFLASYTGIFRGYFHGHNMMDVYAIGQLIEQIVRIILVYVYITPSLSISLEKGVIAAVLSLSIGELSQNIYLFIRVVLFTKIKNHPKYSSPVNGIIKTSFNLTINRLSGAIAAFLEPIVFTYAFLRTGLSKEIADELYAIIYGYAIPIILTTNFITAAIESSILPSLTSYYKKQNIQGFNNLIKKSLFLSYIPAALVSFLYFYYAADILQIFYQTTVGASYIKIMAIPSFIGYFEGVFVSALIASENEKKLVTSTILTNIFHLICIYFFVSIPKINALGIVISFSIIMILSTVILALISQRKCHFKIPAYEFFTLTLIYILMMLSGIKLSKLPSFLGFLIASIGFALIIVMFLKSLKHRNSCHHLLDNEYLSK